MCVCVCVRVCVCTCVCVHVRAYGYVCVCMALCWCMCEGEQMYVCSCVWVGARSRAHMCVGGVGGSVCICVRNITMTTQTMTPPFMCRTEWKSDLRQAYHTVSTSRHYTCGISCAVSVIICARIGPMIQLFGHTMAFALISLDIFHASMNFAVFMATRSRHSRVRAWLQQNIDWVMVCLVAIPPVILGFLDSCAIFLFC